MNTCYSCKTPAVKDLRDFGRLPVCNRFLASESEGEALFPFVLAQCQSCGLVQVSQPVPPLQLRSRFEWVTYSEPTAHLNDLVARVGKLPAINQQSAICGIFLPTDPTLNRFNEHGYPCTWRLDIQSDLEVSDRLAGTETIQAQLNRHSAERIKARRGSPNVIVMRHILEHTHNISETLHGVRALLSPNGYAVFEVPNCAPPLANLDYTTLWEEHVLYFTEETFLSCLARNGFEVLHYEQVGVSLLAVTRPAAHVTMPDYDVSRQLALGLHFANSFEAWRERVIKFLTEFKTTQGNIALFGAGHLSCTFVNLLRRNDLISCIIDDHERKQRMFMPGCKLPICASSALLERDIKLCLSSLGEHTDIKVAQKNSQFVASGGTFASVLPGKTYFLGN